MPSGYPSSGYPSGTAPYGGAANPGNPSPYQALGSGGYTGDYRTADARGSTYMPPNLSTPPANPYGAPSAAATPGTWNSTTPGRGTGAYGQVEPAGYGDPSGTTYPQTSFPATGAASPGSGYAADPRAWSSGAAPSSTSPYRTSPSYGAPTSGTATGASAAGLSSQSGAYRPGSTSRTTGALGSQTPVGGTTASGYGSYPATSTTTQPMPSPSPSYGGYAYPSTGQ